MISRDSTAQHTREEVSGMCVCLYDIYSTVKPPIFPSNCSGCRVTTFDMWEIPQKILCLFCFQFQDIPWILILAKKVFYHTSQWKIVFSYVCLGRTLLFEFILSTQFFMHHIQVLRKISFFSSPSLDIIQFKELYLATLFSSHAASASYLLELPKNSLYRCCGSSGGGNMIGGRCFGLQ